MIFHRLLVAVASGLCLVFGGFCALVAEHNFDGVYTGKRSLTKGSPGPNCPTEGKVSVSIHGETLTFTNSALKKLTKPFYPGPYGSFGQTYTDEGGDIVHYYGRIIGDVMDADVTNPACEYHWHLKKE